MPKEVEYVKVSDTVFKEIVTEPIERPLTIVTLKRLLEMQNRELAMHQSHAEKAQEQILETEALLAKAVELGVVEKVDVGPIGPGGLADPITP